MKIARSIQELREELARVGSSAVRRRRALVPTMGNLHEGHLSLIQLAREQADFVVVSIFVNRLQFETATTGGGDFDRYPRTMDADVAKLKEENVDLLFAPADERELYPEPQEFYIVPPSYLSDVLEGETRSNHFVGVCVVVMKLFWCVQPDLAVLSKKDYQQVVIIERLRDQFAIPVKILRAETVRDQGLALSSRNGFLTEQQRKEAPNLYRILREVADRVKPIKESYDPDAFEALDQRAIDALAERGWKPFYVTTRDRKTLKKPRAGNRDLVILAAAQLGTVRLIDNIEVSRDQ